VNYLKELEHLESLNLFGTNVTDSCLPILSEISRLKRVYLWNTKVTQNDVKALQKANTDLEVLIGVSSN